MIIKSKSKNQKFLGFLLILVIIFLNAIGPYFELQQIATLGLIPFLTIIALNKQIKNKKYDSSKEFLYYFMILATSLFTVFYYIGFNEFNRNFSLLFGSVLSAYIVLVFTNKNEYTNYFHFGYILTIITLFIIMIFRDTITPDFATALDFRDRFLLNANTYSYFCIFANFSLFYLFLQKRNKLILASLIILPTIFFIIAFTTQSRAGLVLLIFINLIFWFFVYKPDSTQKIKKIIIKLILALILLFSSIKFLDVYDGSRISRRVDQTSQRKDSRELLFEEGIEVFKKNPIFGVGLGQFPLYSEQKLFTHNSYTEILAEQGIIGAIFLMLLYFKPTLSSFKNFRKDIHNPFLRCNLLFFTTFIIYNNAYVFYKFPFSMMYFFLVISIQKNYKETINTKQHITDL